MIKIYEKGKELNKTNEDNKIPPARESEKREHHTTESDFSGRTPDPARGEKKQRDCPYHKAPKARIKNREQATNKQGIAGTAGSSKWKRKNKVKTNQIAPTYSSPGTI